MLNHVYDYAIRFDIVRDVTHILVAIVDNIDLITKNVRQSFEHTHVVMYFDVIDRYVDELNLKFYNA